jgi:ABC-type Fe3+-hydroxamate transport system substrate-binding protein
MPTPQRIVSLSPTLTELLLSLGAAERLVGVSDAYDGPIDAAVARLGGSGNPDVAAAVALRPDLVLVERGDASATASGALAAAGLPVVSAGARTVAEAIELVEELAEALGVEGLGAALACAMRAAWERAEARLGLSESRRVLAFTWRDPWLAVGAESYAADVLRLCGALNVAVALPGRSPRAALELFLARNPQVILLARGPYPFGDEDLGAFWRFGDVDAVRTRRVYVVDGRLLLRYGARTVEALDTLSALLAGR